MDSLTPPGWQPDDGVIHGSQPVGTLGQVSDVPSFEAARQEALKPTA